jgi:menaquinol-cytochrome c reductase iron-sulfur subunit
MAGVGHEHGISRRGFVAGVVGILGAIIGAIIGIPAIAYLIAPALERTRSDEWVPLGPVEDLPLGEPTLFSFTRTRQVGWERSATSYGVYATKLRNGEFDIFSNVCTHLSCRVSWKEEQGEFICPCHDGHFAKDGSIVSGPQPRPLDRFEHKVEDGTLMIHLLEG